MELIDIPTEQTTAATDFALAVLAAGCAVYLYRLGQHNSFRRNVWSWVFGLLALAAALGAVAHGFKISTKVSNLLWQPLNVSLGLAVALFAVGAVYDMLGSRIAQRVLLIMITVGAVFYAVTLVFPNKFLVFVIFEMSVMLFALGVYCTLAIRGRLEGAGLIAAGILITIAAAAVHRCPQSSCWQPASARPCVQKRVLALRLRTWTRAGLIADSRFRI